MGQVGQVHELLKYFGERTGTCLKEIYWKRSALFCCSPSLPLTCKDTRQASVPATQKEESRSKRLGKEGGFGAREDDSKKSIRFFLYFSTSASLHSAYLYKHKYIVQMRSVQNKLWEMLVMKPIKLWSLKGLVTR
jgi:hypothetical protein